MEDGWRVDNFYRRGDSQTAKWRPKKGEEYETTYSLDLDGDGESDEDLDTNRYDLKLTHAEHDGVVFLRMSPMSTDQGEKRLSVLVRRYVEGLSGAGYTRLAWEESDVVVEKRYAASVELESEATVAGRKAYAATIVVKNIDQVRLDPTTPGGKLEVVLAHMPFRYLEESPPHGEVEFPVVMVAVYYNRASEFDEGLPAFRGFLDRIVVDGKSGASVDYGAGRPPSDEGASGSPEAETLEDTEDVATPGQGDQGEEAPSEESTELGASP